ncbi:flagellar basal body-associated FliL family protein [Pukyongiella litopenaei]|uniref:Flagellar protein FliL n=1 Tax=Pukyongiella litopenaei TaxID=2605946 RepID=A0A2S0MVA9_9RHOB|nr:flagellar basal body-associated FliL family protein [Pukyongiella litopenaei]AVO39829.1 flagellar basal body protein FliL [Pukyongiella litopenaei]
MSDATVNEEDAVQRPSRKPIVIGAVLMVAGAVGGFLAVSSGLLPVGEPAPYDKADSAPIDFTFVELDPIMISITAGGVGQHLRFRGQLETGIGAQHEVERLRPRIVDVLNGYLRALEPADLSDPMALTRLRGQMLRRVQVVAGHERVRDLLIMEFVVN